MVKTQSDKQAEATYRASPASRWNWPRSISSASACRRSTPTTKLLASRNAQLSTLQADNTLRMQQEEQVAARQQQSRQEATALADQQKDVRQQLRDLQRQIDALQASRPSSAARARRPSGQVSALQCVRHAIWRAVWARFLVFCRVILI